VVEEECPEPKNGEVRVRVLAAGVSLPDIMGARRRHPETPGCPSRRGGIWLVWWIVSATGSLESNQARLLPRCRSRCLRGVRCLPQRELVQVPPGLDAAEAVSLGLNYITAYQMLHRSAEVRPGQRALIHGAAGGVGTALLQLGRLAGLEMYGTCSSRGASTVSDLGRYPRLITSIRTSWQKFASSRARERTSSSTPSVAPICGVPGRLSVLAGRLWVMASFPDTWGGIGFRSSWSFVNAFVEPPFSGCNIAGGWLLPGRKRVVPYSIQTLKRWRPDLFRQDWIALLELLRQQKIKPLIAQRFPLAEARRAQELLGKGGVMGKIVLVCNGSSLESGAA